MMRLTLGLLAIAGLSACASTKTTGEVAMARCPTCEEEFLTHTDPARAGSQVIHGLVSTYVSEPREPPLDGYFPAGGRVLTCPYCLYTAAERTFADIDREEQARLRKALADLSLPPGSDRPDIDIARACEKERRPDPRRDLDLEILAYFSAPGERTLEDRKRLRARIVRALAADSLSAHDRARLVYIAGEISHQMGRTNDARRLFEAASRLAIPLGPAARTEGPNGDVTWVPGWSAAQLRRIEMESSTVAELGTLARGAKPIGGLPGRRPPPGDAEVALQVLARRDDPEAWAVLQDFVGEDVEKLHTLVLLAEFDQKRMRLAPGLYSFAENRYLRHEDDLIGDVIFESGKREPEVDPGALERFEAELAGQPPSPGTREALLDALPSLIEEGSAEATWCLLELVAGPGDERTDHRVGKCIDAVERTPALWPFVRQSLPPLTPETDTAYLMLAAASGAEPEISRKLKDRLDEGRDEDERDLILGFLAARADRAAVAHALEWCLDPPCLSYLSSVGGPKEAREVARMAKWTFYADDRRDLERCLRQIHIRLATRPGPATGPATADSSQ